jgi:MFS family permease
MTTKLIPKALKALTRDGWLLFLTRFARLFAYGSLSVILVFYLVGLGLTEAQSGLILTLTLAGDVVVSLLLTTQADRIGRRRHVGDRRRSRGRRGFGLCVHTKSILLDRSGHHRGHQPERQ